MSRTDKDRPYRVRAADARTLREEHDSRCERHTPRRPEHRGVLPCDIDASGIHTRCYRTGSAPQRFWWMSTCPSGIGYRDWTRPDRQRARLALRAALREHNADGDTDIEPPIEQHRHRGRYDCW
jgi:hypothetical protein